MTELTAQELVRFPLPILGGERETTAGYYSMEAQERVKGIDVLGLHTEAVGLWYRALTICMDGLLTSEWRYQGDGEAGGHENVAWQLRMQLLAASSHAAKGILDLTMACQYNLAEAGIRHLVETILQIDYLHGIPEESGRWHGAPGPADKTAMAQGKKVKRPFEPPSTGEMITRLEKLYAGVKDAPDFSLLIGIWKAMCQGVHPTSVGVSYQMDEDGSHTFGAK